MKFYSIIQTFSKLDANKTGVPDKRAFAKKRGDAIRLARKWNNGQRLVKPTKEDGALLRVSKDGLIRVQKQSMRSAEVVQFINSLVDPLTYPHPLTVHRANIKLPQRRMKGPMTKLPVQYVKPSRDVVIAARAASKRHKKAAKTNAKARKGIKALAKAVRSKLSKKSKR